jgi:hypothetical protein
MILTAYKTKFLQDLCAKNLQASTWEYAAFLDGFPSSMHA